MPIRLLIGADLVPTKSNYELFKRGDAENLLGSDLYEKINSTDFTIFNLEVPLTDVESPIDKCGPNLSAPTYTINGLKAINPYFFTLANNHILDQGEQGLISTMNVLVQNGIAFAGAGRNLKEASKPYIVDLKGIKLGIYCCAEHEFSIATENTAGANPFDPLESLDYIYELKKQCDYVIVLYHGGKEHYRYPSPYLQKVCRKIVEKGADLVVCQHSHCIGAEEVWKSGRIIYGQGNFIFDNSNSDFWKTSILVEVQLEMNSNKIIETKMRYYPIVKCNEKIRLDTNNSHIILEFRKRSDLIANPDYVRNEYQKFADVMLEGYLNAFRGSINRNLCYRILNRLLGHNLSKWIVKGKYKKQDKLVIQNYIECEAHRELILCGLRKYIR